MERIFLNLFSNAFKFKPEGGRIQCALWVDRDQTVISMQDNGPGVKPELRKVIFERFRQGEAEMSRRFGGTGLGLAIAKDFVTLHRGVYEK